MMATTTAAVISLRAGNRLLSNSFHPSDSDHGPAQISSISTKNLIVAQKSHSNLNSNSSSSSNRAQIRAVKALKEHVNAPTSVSTSEESVDLKASLESLILLQKSMLEKQWKIPFDFDRTGPVKVNSVDKEKRGEEEGEIVVRSGLNARQRRNSVRKRFYTVTAGKGKEVRHTVSPELLQTGRRGYLKKGIIGEELLGQDKVVHLSKKIKDGLILEKHRSRLKEKLGFDPTDKQLASSLRISCAELRLRLLESSLAKEKLTMSNVPLVKSIALKFNNMGAEMDDLIQGGMVGLLRGIEKYDPSKGCKVSTYVYWWIRQGVSRALVENSRTLRLPVYLHERLSMIRNAKARLEQEGITPTIENIAESLNMSQKKVRNATEAFNKVFSLDKGVFPSLDGLPGETLHSYVQDKNPANDPWHAFQRWYIKEEVNKLLNSTLNKREGEIIRLYHGIGGECYTWEDIGKQYGLSRERVRQVGLVAMEKLKHAARKRELEAVFIKFQGKKVSTYRSEFIY